MPDTSKLEKLNRELEKSEKKLRKAINDEKALQHQLKQLTIFFQLYLLFPLLQLFFLLLGMAIGVLL